MKHLLSTGYPLTECHLTAARPDELTPELDEMTCPDCRAALIASGVCPNCGSTDVAWGHTPTKKSAVPDGRLTLHDVETHFHLGCGECSETLIHSVTPELAAIYLTAQKWRP